MSNLATLAGASALKNALQDFGDAFNANKSYVVYTDVEYAQYQEYGTVHQPGTPHFRPAVEKTSANFGQYLKNSSSIEVGLERAAQEVAATAARMAPVDTGQLRNSYTVQSV